MIKKVIQYFKEFPERIKYAYYQLKLNHKWAWETSRRLAGKNDKK